jgi:spore maturation protein CgeB
MNLPKKILIAYDEFPPIAYDLAEAFLRLGVETRLFLACRHEHWFYKHVIRRVNKQARNLRLVKKGRDLFANHPLNRLRYLTSHYQEMLDKFQPDFVFFIHGQPFGNPVLSQIAVPKVAWWIEPDTDLDALRQYAAPFDIYLSFNTKAKALLEAVGFKTGFLNHAAAPSRFYPLTDRRQTYDAVFVGNWSPWREEVISRLLTVTKNVALYGPYWKKKSKLANADLARIYKGKHIEGDELNRLLNSAKIVLNAQRFRDSSGLNMRFFEVLAAQACFLTDAAPELEHCFIPGEHLCVYRDLEELRQQVTMLLADQDMSGKIGLAGYRYVLENHTYEHRARTLLALFDALQTEKAAPTLHLV